ncbi:uncharacterized protein LOC127249542 isoform X1 [Andrographis paniculata]|uniref:uncharacterized protein LOC127249542 isoform X1 n=1 Tax=Andrographis paniculata TaxID=175694 RepID=UPI0021E8C7EF|nr:uncharacterized protein LOC127249542 isoform X1 [Andrographis paniculata]XP_051128363.1 uncharacterized protein LOC127249542 isoform X1 [Andrographis paniculata]
MASGQLFSKTTQALFYNYKQLPIQRMLDFDFLCGRETPSVAGIISPGSEGFQKLFFGQEEIAIPVHSTIEAACAAHPTADVFINFASFRSAAASSMSALKQATIKVVAIIAEGVPELDTKQLIAYAKSNNKVVIGPATVGGIQAGAFKIGDTAGTLDNIIHCKLYRPGSVGFVSKSGGMSNEMYNTIARVSDGIYEGIAIGGDVFPGSTLSDHVLRFNNIPQRRRMTLTNTQRIEALEGALEELRTGVEAQQEGLSRLESKVDRQVDTLKTELSAAMRNTILGLFPRGPPATPIKGSKAQGAMAGEGEATDSSTRAAGISGAARLFKDVGGTWTAPTTDFKLKDVQLPSFDGHGPLDWVARAEQHFVLHGVPEEIKVSLARVSMEDVALHWSHWHMMKHASASWIEFSQALVTRFDDRECQGKWLCYKCKQPYSPLHKCESKYVNVVVKDDLGNWVAELREMRDGEFTEEAEPTMQVLPLYALAGFSGPRTMRLRGNLLGFRVTVLIDSGASHNFISQKLVLHAKLNVDTTQEFNVVLGDGRKVASTGVCSKLSIQIDGAEVQADCHVFSLCGVDIIFGVVWLRTLGKIQMDWEALEMQYYSAGQQVTLRSDPGLYQGPKTI